MEEIVITGAAGNIGRRLIAALLTEKKYILYALVRQKPSPPLPKEVVLIQGSLPNNIPNFTVFPREPIIIHLAALTHSCNASEYFRVNELGTKYLLQIVQPLKVRHFILISTRAIQSSGGAYSRSKEGAERLVKTSTLPYTIIRFGEIYGTDSKEGIDQLVKQVKQGNYVFIPGKGEAHLAPLEISDAVRAIKVTLSKQPRNRIITVTGPKEYQLNQIVQETALFFRTKPVIIYIPYWILRLLSLIVCFLPHPPFYPDQLNRLLSPKETSTKETLRVLEPKSFQEALHGKSFI